MSIRALVTGGAGFIGSHLVDGLLAAGHRVVVLDNFSTGKRENLCDSAGRIEVLEGDITDLETCQRACSRIDVVYHLAALGSVPRSVADPIATNEVNVRGTLNVLIAAQKCGVRRFVFSSSSSVYGDTPVLPKHEQMRPSPRSPYAVSKLAGEEYCRAFLHSYGLETVALRYFNVFGPRQDPGSQYAAVVPRFLAALSSGSRPVIYGNGSQSRDFTYVANVVSANMLAAQAADVSGDVFNIAGGEQITVCELLKAVANRLGKPANPEFSESRPGDIKHSLAAIEHAQERLGYRRGTSFREGVDLTVAAFTTLRIASSQALGI